MSYWFGYQAVELDGSNPGRKCLSEPFNSYEKAKLGKQKCKALDMLTTAVFQSDSKESAELQLKNENCSRL